MLTLTHPFRSATKQSNTATSNEVTRNRVTGKSSIGLKNNIKMKKKSNLQILFIININCVEIHNKNRVVERNIQEKFTSSNL